jgi:hypothetical protein
VSTVQDLVVAAYGYSSRNVPDVLVTTGFQSELTHLVARLQRALYTYAATVNPVFFAGFQDVDFTSDPDGEVAGWPRPATAITVFRQEHIDSAGNHTKVVKVNYDDRQAEQGEPCIYALGQKYFPAGNPLDPTGGTLRFFFSRVPTDPTSFTSPLDSQWPETYDTLLIVQIAAYLAQKDGRTDEMQALQADEQAWMKLFTDFLMHPDADERRRIAAVRRTVSPVLSPVTPG